MKEKDEPELNHFKWISILNMNVAMQIASIIITITQVEKQRTKLHLQNVLLLLLFFGVCTPIPGVKEKQRKY